MNYHSNKTLKLMDRIDKERHQNSFLEYDENDFLEALKYFGFRNKMTKLH